MINVVGVAVGTKYPPEIYVENLWLGLNKHLSKPFFLTILTDNPDHAYYHSRPINTVRIPQWPEVEHNPRRYWWYKMFLFNPQFPVTGDVLYLDMDTCIVGSMDKFFEYTNKFCICQDFNRKWIPQYGVCNSSVMRWNTDTHAYIWEQFDQQRSEHIKKFKGDQDFVTDTIRDKEYTWWPKEWAMSFKWEVYRGGLINSGTGLDNSGQWPADANMYHVPDQPWVLYDSTSVVVFHGKPEPAETQFFKQHSLVPNL